MIQLIGRLRNLIDIDIETEENHYCKYCDRHFGSETTLEMHYKFCREKALQEDLYAFPENTEKGIVEVEGWDTVKFAEQNNPKCFFCHTTIELNDDINFVVYREGEGAYHNWCAEEQQRLEGDREL